MKIICVGQNYQLHNIEMGCNSSEAEENPILFLKPETALLTDDKKQFYIPDFTSNVHYEAEIVVKIEKLGKNIAERFAHRYYNELTVGIDLTARDLQAELKQKGLPWEISKAFDNSAVVGSFISTEILNVNDIEFSLDLNGKEVQRGNTSDMIHSIDKLVAYISRFFTLKTGDLIFTGTPAGVGQLHVGDYLEAYLQDEKLLEMKIC